jgi:hypothetical protein
LTGWSPGPAARPWPPPPWPPPPCSNPCAAGIQGLVDRRFNRRRYDATRTVERFTVRLRDQVDLDGLRGELLAVIDHTMQPTQAWLWLRPPGGPTSAVAG